MFIFYRQPIILLPEYLQLVIFLYASNFPFSPHTSLFTLAACSLFVHLSRLSYSTPSSKNGFTTSISLLLIFDTVFLIITKCGSYHHPSIIHFNVLLTEGAPTCFLFHTSSPFLNFSVFFSFCTFVYFLQTHSVYSSRYPAYSGVQT